MAIKNINDRDKWDDFCQKLIEKTNNGQLEWEDWSNTIYRENSRSKLFVTEHKDWHILVYKHAFKYFQDEDNYEWEEDINMEIVEPDGEIKWTIPKVVSRKKLLDLLQYQDAGVQDLLDDLLEG